MQDITTKFPLNYLMSFWSPTACFTQRFNLKKRQVVWLILIMVGMMLLPMSFQIGNIQMVNLDQFVPQATALIDDNLASEVAAHANAEGGLTISANQLVKDVDKGVTLLAVDAESARAYLSKRNGVALTPTAFYLTTVTNKLIEQPYDMTQSFKDVSSGEMLQTQLSDQWFRANRLSVVLTVFINTWILLVTSFALLLFGVALLLSFMRFTSIFSIRSYREALAVCLNCFGLPTLLAMIVGFVTANPAHVLTVQGLGFMLMMIWIYWSTHFQDRYVELKQGKSAS